MTALFVGGVRKWRKKPLVQRREMGVMWRSEFLILDAAKFWQNGSGETQHKEEAAHVGNRGQ